MASPGPERVHPDSLTGDELAEVVELFAGVYWDDPGAVAARVDDLRVLAGEDLPGGEPDGDGAVA